MLKLNVSISQCEGNEITNGEIELQIDLRKHLNVLLEVMFKH